MGDRRRRAVPAAVAPGDDAVTTASELLARACVGARRAPARRAPGAHADWLRELEPRRERRRCGSPRCCTTSSAQFPIRARRSTPRATGRWSLRRLPPGRSAAHLARWMARARARSGRDRRLTSAAGRACTSAAAGPRPTCSRPPTRSRSWRRSTPPLVASWIASGRCGRGPVRWRSSTACWSGSASRAARELGRALYEERARGCRRACAGCGRRRSTRRSRCAPTLGEERPSSPAARSSACSLRRGSSRCRRRSSRCRACAGLDCIERDGDELLLGAMATHRAIERCALVRDGWPALAHASARSRTCACATQATIGGVLADADYASDPPSHAPGARRAGRAREPARRARARRRRADPRPLRDGDRSPTS